MTKVKLAELYDDASRHYQQADYFNLISQPKETALTQLQEYHALDHNNLQVIDLGVGDGRFLHTLYKYNPNIQCTGLDISAEMLKLASKQLPLNAVQATIDQASQILPSNQFDIAIANFVCAYVPLSTVLQQSSHLLKNNGLLSLTSTTLESFVTIQQQIALMGTSWNPIKRFNHFFANRAIKKATVPVSRAAALQIAAQQNFTVLKQQTLRTEIHIKNPQEFIQMAFEGGWALSALDYQWAPIKLAYAVTKLLVNAFDFPIKDTAVIEVLLLQKHHPERSKE